MARAANAIEDESGDFSVGPIAAIALHERRNRGARAGSVDDEHDRPADDGGKLCRRSGAPCADAVEQPHRALAQHKLGRGARGERRGERRAPHRPRIEIAARQTGRRREKRSIYIVGTRLRHGDAHSPSLERAQER